MAMRTGSVVASDLHSVAHSQCCRDVDSLVVATAASASAVAAAAVAS